MPAVIACAEDGRVEPLHSRACPRSGDPHLGGLTSLLPVWLLAPGFVF
ncbi:hypothetical protein HMPREF0972_02637 [Actinomyces sp. oral taxon 848 str. F0332]|nr:hypothetical protein HMPREF0972_02637 [Actinomyces sp. oral taxon 848 str. F0332]